MENKLAKAVLLVMTGVITMKAVKAVQYYKSQKKHTRGSRRVG